LVRDVSKLKQKANKLTFFEGNVLNLEDVSKTIKDADLVVSLFGHVKNSPEWLQTNGTKNIIAAMNEHQVDRIISLSAGGLPFPAKDEPKFIDKLIRTIMKIVVPKVLNDAIAHHE
jgi:putative NADH-flavin reductase